MYNMRGFIITPREKKIPHNQTSCGAFKYVLIIIMYNTSNLN